MLTTLTRRDLIKRAAWLAGLVLVPLHWLGLREVSSGRCAEAQPRGELYAGFLLLPEGASVPDSVKYPRLGAPTVCGVADAGMGVSACERLTAKQRFVATAAELAQEVSFPLYIFDSPPPSARLGSASVLSHPSGEVYSTTLGYEVYNPETECWECKLSLCTFPDFPRPFPVWFRDAIQPDTLPITIARVDFLPSPGITVVGQGGYVCLWIAGDVLYTMAVDLAPTTSEAQQLLPSAQQPHALAESLRVLMVRGGTLS